MGWHVILRGPHAETKNSWLNPEVEMEFLGQQLPPPLRLLVAPCWVAMSHQMKPRQGKALSPPSPTLTRPFLCFLQSWALTCDKALLSGAGGG